MNLPTGVMLNAYPDSIGRDLSDIVELLERPEFKDVFSLFYVLPTAFHSDLDRGFSVIDYDLNEDLVSPGDFDKLRRLGIDLKFDLVLNHLSVGSPQFQDLLAKGDASPYRDFFIDWNAFWHARGQMSGAGHIVPNPDDLQKLFMRKPGLPILDVRFPDGSDRPYWNTFYQQVTYPEIMPGDLKHVDSFHPRHTSAIAKIVNHGIGESKPIADIDFGRFSQYKDEIVAIVESKRRYLGQMDLNARSELVWEFYDDTLKKLSGYGARLIRLDAFAYLHKQPGESNFFNKPGTWEYLARLKAMAEKHDLVLLPEIHAEYGKGLHKEVAAEGFPVYDFFFPGLVIDALDRGTNRPLRRWIRELQQNNIKTINMLGCHDGIPVLDLKGGGDDGLLSDAEIDAVMDRIIERGGRVKNLFGPDGRKIAYYQVNATFFSALGESERKLRLARAIQMFMPGIPQVWYLDLFAGANDYAAADRGGIAGHKEINRTTLEVADIVRRLDREVVRDQLDLMRLRTTCGAFAGALTVSDAADHRLSMRWVNGDSEAVMEADLRDHGFTVSYRDGGKADTLTYA